MQTLKDRLVGLLSSPNVSNFELVNDYPDDKATLFKYVRTGTQFYIGNKYLDELVQPFVAEISFQLTGMVHEYIVPANGYMPHSNNVIMKGSRNSNPSVKMSISDLAKMTDIIRAIDSINIQAKDDNDYMVFISKLQEYLDVNYQTLKQLPHRYL